MKQEEKELLIKRAQKRDPDAFTELMQLSMKDMYRVALAILMNDHDAADAIQDTILVCWEKLDTLKNPYFFKTWMTRILINKCYDIKGAASRIVYLEEYRYEEPAAENSCNLELKEALAALDEKYRIVISLFYGEGYHVEEIAKLLKIPQSTVRTRLQRGREKLAAYYGIRERKGKRKHE